MSFTDHKITQFQHKVSDLPDEPQIPAADLKSRFDACPEELRQSLNAVCDDAARLEARVEGIVVDTFGDTIDKEMLSDELAAELDGKATQTALDSEVSALDSRLDSVETTLPQKCEVVFGSYVGDSVEDRVINLGFRPLALIIASDRGYITNSGYLYGAVVTRDSDALHVKLTDNGFQLPVATSAWPINILNSVYVYMAVKPTE